MANGLATIDARTKLCKQVYCLIYLLSDNHSCKHLCCREGLDKVPKPPKESTKNMDHQCKTGSSAPPQSQHKVSLRSFSGARDLASIETIDLSSSRDGTRSVKQESRTRKRLDKLHENTRNGPLVQTIANRKPQYSYAKDEEPKIPFLNRSRFATERQSQNSSDYEASWMDDLPSPSVLLKDLEPQYHMPTEIDHEDTGANDAEPLCEPLTMYSPGPVSIARQGRISKLPIAKHDSPKHADPTLRNPRRSIPLQQSTSVESESKMTNPFLEGYSRELAEDYLEAITRVGNPSVGSHSRNDGEQRGKPHERVVHLEPSPRPRKMARIGKETPISTHHPINEERPQPQEAADVKSQPFRNMEGIDLDLLAQFQGIVEFVE